MKEKQIKNLIRAMVLNTNFDGIDPSHHSYGENWQSVNAEVNYQVDEIFSTFQMLEDSDEEDLEA
jgi:hypothetical protein